MMSIAVNGRFLSRQVTGVERYGQEILKRLEPDLRIIHPSRGARGLSGHAWEQLILPAKLRPRELLWSPANTGPLAVRNQVWTVHDLSPLEHPEWYMPAFAHWYRCFVPLLAHRAKQVVVSSDYMRRKILRRFAMPRAKVTVVPGGVDHAHFKPGLARLASLPGEYVLFVGSLQQRKNLGLLLQAWKLIQPKHPHTWLLIAGASGIVFNQTAFPTDLEHVGWLGYIPEAELPRLYANALVFVHPSLEEGFGLTALEAMACGAPLLAARAGALPEVVGDAALWFQSDNVSQLAENLNYCLNEPGLRAALAEKSLARAEAFGWDQPAKLLWEVMQWCQ